MSTKGVLMYAHNNDEIDYFKIACANALMVKKNLQVPVSIVTDPGSLNWAITSMGRDFIDRCFDTVIEVERVHTFNNKRTFSDTSYATKTLQFYNCKHWEAYTLSPYDETLFIDSDYLIMSSVLGNCWGSNHDVMVDHRIYSPYGSDPRTRMLDELSITLYWATVIYFRKSSLAEHLFNIVKHIEDNYAYYRDLYSISSSMYRNDHAFSIAIHMLNGFSKSSPAIHELPITGLLMSWDTFDVYNVNDINDITLYIEKPKHNGEYTLARIKGTDAHIMNKWAINRVADRLIDLYKESSCHAGI